MSVTQTVASKRTLVTLSHAIEKFALSGSADEPAVIVAMFQRLAYFEREVEMYRRIAATGAVTVVGIVEDLPPTLAPGIHHVMLSEDESLAREWSVTVLTPSAGATLVAHDSRTVVPDRSLDNGRQFTGGWSFTREDAYTELTRLRDAMASRLLAAGALPKIDAVLRDVISSPGNTSETRPDAALRHLVEVAVRSDLHRGAYLVEREMSTLPAHELDGRTGLRSECYLRRWIAGSATGTVSIGLLALRLHGINNMQGLHGPRTRHAATQLVGGILGRHLRPVDRAISLGGSDFLLLLPTAGENELRQLYDTISVDLDAAENRYPFVPLPRAGAATVTADRPLPLGPLVQAAGAGTPSQMSMIG